MTSSLTSIRYLILFDLKCCVLKKRAEPCQKSISTDRSFWACHLVRVQVSLLCNIILSTMDVYNCFFFGFHETELSIRMALRPFWAGVSTCLFVSQLNNSVTRPSRRPFAVHFSIVSEPSLTLLLQFFHLPYNDKKQKFVLLVYYCAIVWVWSYLNEICYLWAENTNIFEIN